MPTTLCKNPCRVYWLLIIFRVSGFPVIIKFQPATCNLQPAKDTCRVLMHCLSSFLVEDMFLSLLAFAFARQNRNFPENVVFAL